MIVMCYILIYIFFYIQMKVVCLLVMYVFLLNQYVLGKSLLYILNVFDNKNIFFEMLVDFCFFYLFIMLFEMFINIMYMFCEFLLFFFLKVLQ